MCACCLTPPLCFSVQVSSGYQLQARHGWTHGPIRICCCYPTLIPCLKLVPKATLTQKATCNLLNELHMKALLALIQGHMRGEEGGGGGRRGGGEGGGGGGGIKQVCCNLNPAGFLLGKHLLVNKAVPSLLCFSLQLHSLIDNKPRM